MPPAAGRKPGSTTDSEAYTVREDDILFVIARARRLTEQVCRELTQQSGLRLVELDILYYLSRGHAGDTARDIIGAKHLSKAHISKSVDNLRRTGCVTLREDAADRRCLHLCLTDKGREYAARFARIMRTMGRQLLEGVTPEERRAVHSTLQKIRRNLEAATEATRQAHPGRTEETK